MKTKFSTFIAILFGVAVLTAAQLSPVSALEAGDIVMQVNPAEQSISLNPSEVYRGSIKVQNIGRLPFTFTLSTKPYQVLNDNYDPDFYTQNDYTKLSNWITYDENNIRLEPGVEREVGYTINVPDDIPGGGQYAAIIIETRDSISEGASFRVISQLASLIYAHVSGEEHIGGVVTARSLPSFLLSSPFTARVTVKNDGNVDFRVTHTLDIYNFFTNQPVLSSDAVSSDGTNVGRATPIILPATSRANALTWDGAPELGLFRAVQKISFLDQEYTYEQVVFLCPTWLAGLAIFFVALMVIWIILRIRKRHKSRPQSF